MSYIVRYGFGKNRKLLREKFLSASENYYDASVRVKTYICFARYIRERQDIPEAIRSSIYYSLTCYEPWLKELIGWVNSLNNGVKVRLVKTGKDATYFVGVEYILDKETFTHKKVYKKFEFGKTSIIVPKSIAEPIENIKANRCAITISVSGNKSKLSKVLLEYVLLTLFRTLSIHDAYFGHMQGDGSIIERVISGSTFTKLSKREIASNHCLYEGAIKESELIKALDIKNAERTVVDENYIGRNGSWGMYGQTALINSFIHGADYKEIRYV